MNKFPLTLAAIKAAEQNQWAIGDALVAECGLPVLGGRDNRGDKLAEAGQYLLSQGYDYAVNTLSAIRLVAARFTSTQRRNEISFTVHKTAGSPEFLEAVIAGAPKGTRITQDYIEGIRRVQAEHDRREREEAAEEAHKEREKAEAEEATAKAKAREAKDAEEKKVAEARLEKAKAKTTKAKVKERETKTAPKKKAQAPKQDEVPLMAIEAQFIADAAQSVRLAKASAKRIRESLDQLNAKGIAALTEAALEAANAWTEAAQLVRSEIIEKHGHLSVVGD